MQPKNRQEHKARLLAALDRLREQIVRDEVHSLVAVSTMHTPGHPDESVRAQAHVHICESHAGPLANAMSGVIAEFGRDGLVPVAVIRCQHHDEEPAERPTLN